MDEDSMRRALVRALRARGVDVTTALDEGLIERDDAEHLDHATALGRVLYTFNVADFHRLHRDYLTQGKNHAGIILAPQPCTELVEVNVTLLVSKCAGC